MKRAIFSFGILLFLFQIVAAEGPAKAKLDSCIVYYQNGEYQKTVDSIKAIIPLLSDKRDEAEAYKYIGFSYCMLDMINKAKDFFKVALEKFPQLMIDTLEVPPNITIVFKQTQIETQMEKGELIQKDKQGTSPVIATIFGSVGVVSGAVGGYFLYSGIKAHQSYRKLGKDSPLDQFDLYAKRQKNDFIIGGATLGFACANVIAAVWFIAKKPPSKKPHASLDIQGNGVLFTWHF